MPFAQLLSLEGAVRHADYSHAGQATSWKAGAIWEPTDGLRLRATISRAIRAPNIFEAFRPSEGQTTNVEDPCAETNLGDTPNRAANCAALDRPDGFTPLNGGVGGSDEHTSELQYLMRISHAVFCLTTKHQT